MAFLTGSGWLGKEEAQKNGYNAWKRFWRNVWYVVSFGWARAKAR